MTRTLLITSGWQDINIGDVGHSPGLLALLERYAPDANLIFWPHDPSPAVDAMLRRRFPDLEIVHGEVTEEAAPNEAIASAFGRADLLIHGSGPDLVARRALTEWRRRTGKPYGIYGVTLGNLDRDRLDVLDEAAFVFTRETRSLAALRAAGTRCPIVDFAPDACAAIDVRDDAKAREWIERAGLADGPFLCVVARNRKTPYHWSKQSVMWPQDHIREVEDTNHRHREQDLAKLRSAITAWVRRTGLKVMLCPEMIDALSLLGPHVYAPLPDDVRPLIVIRDKWWLPDEAASIYRNATALLSLDCHSPLIASANGTPAVYVRQPQDALKAHMYADFGMGDWVMPIEDVDGDAISARLMDVHQHPQASRAYLARGMARIESAHQQTLTRALSAAFG